MAAPTITEVMDGIETRLLTLNTATGLRVTSEVADQVNPPQAVVGVPDIPDYHETFGHGSMEISPTVTVLVSRTLDRIGQRKLADFMNPTGTSSIHAAIEADETLGGKVDYCIVKSVRKAIETVGGVPYYGAVFTLEVVCKGV